MDAASLQNLQTLDPEFMPIAIKAVDEAQRAMPQGVKVVVVEGRRSFADSDRIFAQGRTAPGAIRTNAPGGKSYHNYGLAFDIAMYGNGREIKTVDTNWLKVVAIMKKYGMAWGGDFRSLYDPGHFEMTFGHNWRDLLASEPGKPSNKLLIAAVIIASLIIYWLVE